MRTYDVYSRLQNNIISPLRNVVDVQKYLEIMAGQFDEIQAVNDKVQYIRSVEKSEGFLLDYNAWLVGTTRSYFDIAPYFSVNAEDVNVENYFWFMKPTDSFLAPEGTFSDVQLRRQVYAKIGYNNSKCTRNENIAIIKNMTLADTVVISNVEPMVLDIELIGTSLYISNDTEESILNILAPGVSIRNLIVTEA